jgi:hypothetical protein
MEYSPSEQFRRANIIIDAVCKVGNITYFHLLSAPKSTVINTLRGVCCIVAWEYGVHARRLAKMIHRTRGNVLNQQRKYLGFLRSKDPMTTEIYNKVREETKLQIDGEV